MTPTVGKTYKVTYVNRPVTILSPYGRPLDQQWLGVYMLNDEYCTAICQADTIEAEVTVAHLDVHLVPGTEPGTYRAVAVATGQPVEGSVGHTQCQVTVFTEEAPRAISKRRASKSARGVRGTK